MGEDSIILPIDRVISEDVDGGRSKVDKRGCKFVRIYKRKVSGSTPGSSRRQFFRGFEGCAGKFVIFVGCVLILGGCYLTLGGRDLGRLRMQGDYRGWSRDLGEGRGGLGEDEMETIRRSIVEGLGIQRIPDPSKANVSQTEYERAHVEYLRRLQMSRAPGDRRRRRLHTFHATDEMDQLSRTKRDLSSPQSDTYSLYFPLDVPADDEEVDHAILRLILEPTGASDSVEVSIYRIGETSSPLVSSATFSHLDGPRWIELDVTELVVLWHEGLIDNLGLEVRLKGPLSPNVSLGSPVLNVFTTSGQLRRRRSAPDHLMSLHKGRRTECRGENKKCCRHEMTVIFKDLKGFEFIVQPKTFDAGYCKGRCPPRYNPAHHHALLQSLIWKEDKRKAPRPCCAPSKLAELEILYFDENDPTKLKVSSWKNMRVLECACS
ncbi:bone morphogenetic protein 4 [Diachasma alloeum]|uniref:bone morphogenetic protein 4 n=1 Tax=Diachasma alloeum TaxID=454923 RepID=UPI0007382E82|nr:bone morphogenetic protein 4 [Diachasma alloeum]